MISDHVMDGTLASRLSGGLCSLTQAGLKDGVVDLPSRAIAYTAVENAVGIVTHRLFEDDFSDLRSVLEDA